MTGDHTMARKQYEQHGYSYTPLYKRWTEMLQRCTNPQNTSFQNYGARGIQVEERWYHFPNFLADMGYPPLGTSLERRDNNGNYSKDNCYWATSKQQRNNASTNHVITCQNKTQTLAMWAEEKRINYMTLYTRIRQGWDIEKALTTPVKKLKNRDPIS